MKILAFDTSSSACSVALLNDNAVTSIHQNAPMQQATLILPMIQELLEKASISLDQLDAIAYGHGPGSFTGIRLASSVAKGLSFAHDVPIIEISSLAAMAYADDSPAYSYALVAVDARMGQVYWGVYQGFSHLTLIGQEYLEKPDAIKLPNHMTFQAENCCGIGNGWGEYAQQIMTTIGFQPKIIDVNRQPTGTAVLMLAKQKLAEGKAGITAADAAPIYLR